MKNRDSFLTKIQTIEFLSIIGLIKRAHSIFGTLNTVSGVCVMYRKSAIIDAGWWDQTCVTEDIAITWKMQRKKWKVRFEPDAVCWMLAPEKIGTLFNQRLRWAQGGIDVLLKNREIFSRKNFHFGLSTLYIEQILSIFWSILWYSYLPIVFSKIFLFKDLNIVVLTVALLLAFFSFLQYVVSLFINFHYDKKILRVSIFSIWYILFYWVINPVTILLSIPLALREYGKLTQAVWVSPDRGEKK